MKEEIMGLLLAAIATTEDVIEREPFLKCMAVLGEDPRAEALTPGSILREALKVKEDKLAFLQRLAAYYAYAGEIEEAMTTLESAMLQRNSDQRSAPVETPAPGVLH